MIGVEGGQFLLSGLYQIETLEIEMEPSRMKVLTYLHSTLKILPHMGLKVFLVFLVSLL